jgi:hypothetical protein
VLLSSAQGGGGLGTAAAVGAATRVSGSEKKSGSDYHVRGEE